MPEFAEENLDVIKGKVTRYNELNAQESLESSYPTFVSCIRSIREQIPHQMLIKASAGKNKASELNHILEKLSGKLLEITGLALRAKLKIEEDDDNWHPEHLPQGKRTISARKKYNDRLKELRKTVTPGALEKLLLKYIYEDLLICCSDLNEIIKQDEEPAADNEQVISLAHEKNKTLLKISADISTQYPDIPAVVRGENDKLYKDFREQAQLAYKRLKESTFALVENYQTYQNKLIKEKKIADKKISIYEDKKTYLEYLNNLINELKDKPDFAEKWEKAIVDHLKPFEFNDDAQKLAFAKSQLALRVIGKALSGLDSLMNDYNIMPDQGLGKLYAIMLSIERPIVSAYTATSFQGLEIARNKIVVLEKENNQLGGKYIAKLSKAEITASAGQKNVQQVNKKAETECVKTLKLVEDFRLQIRQVSQSAKKQRTVWKLFSLNSFVSAQKQQQNNKFADLVDDKAAKITSLQTEELSNINQKLKLAAQKAGIKDSEFNMMHGILLDGFNETKELYLQKIVEILQIALAERREINITQVLQHSDLKALEETKEFKELQGAGIKNFDANELATLKGILILSSTQSLYDLIGSFRMKGNLNNAIKENMFSFCETADNFYESQKNAKLKERLFDPQAAILLKGVKSTMSHISKLAEHNPAIKKAIEEYKAKLIEQPQSGVAQDQNERPQKRRSFIIA